MNIGAIRVAVVALCVAASAQAQSNVIWPNDNCANATPIAGSGAWAFDTSSPFLTTGGPPLTSCTDCTCSLPFQGISNDMWFLWTATCNGVAEIKTGVQTDPAPQCNVDTVLAIYNTPCPTGNTQPIACCDDTCAQLGNTCDLSSFVRIDVQCGHQYLIRLGSKPGTPGGYGTLKINCMGQECPDPAAGDCEDCCGSKPTYEDPFYSANYTGQVAVMTGNDDAFGPSATNVVTIFNLKCSAPPPVPGAEWNPVPGPPTTAFRYSKNNWTKNELGSVFGVTLDDQGDIFVTHASFYGILFAGPGGCGPATAIGNLPGSSSTSVYQLASGSGAPSVFVNLPGGSADPADPGLGNIAYDCAHEEFFVSHFGDGRIYRVSPAGTVLGWYDHATNTVGLGATPEPAPTDYRKFVPLGERVWAVKAHNGRLYYSVWGQNPNGFPPSSVTGTTPNRVWSIALTAGAGGNFVAGSRQQELQVPVHPGNGHAPFSVVQFSSPVSDISFSPTCRMLLAERDVSGDNCTLAHSARALEYAPGAGSWVPTNFRGGKGYEIGANVPSADGTNSSGGCDYDYTPWDTCAAGRLWVTGDAVHAPSINMLVYGMTGIDPTTAFGNATGLHVDYSGGYAPFPYDKTKQGDVAVPCPYSAPSCSVDVQTVECELGADGFPSGQFSVTLTIHNNSGQTANLLLFPTLGTFMHLNPPLLSGQSITRKVVVTGMPGDVVSLPIGLYDGTVNCCGIKAEFELPPCDCALVRNLQVTEIDDGNPNTYTYSVSFTLHNISLNPSFTATWMFLIPPSGSNYSFSPTVVNVFPLLAGGQTNVGPLTLTFTTPPPPNWRLQVPLSIHNANLAICCDTILWLRGPLAGAQGCTPDLNGDGQVDGADLGMLLAAWGSTAGGCADLNNDGIVDGSDLGILLAAWGNW